MARESLQYFCIRVYASSTLTPGNIASEARSYNNSTPPGNSRRNNNVYRWSNNLVRFQLHNNDSPRGNMWALKLNQA